MDIDNGIANSLRCQAMERAGLIDAMDHAHRRMPALVVRDLPRAEGDFLRER